MAAPVTSRGPAAGLTGPAAGFAGPVEHLRAELARLDLELARQVLRRRIGGRYAGDPSYRGLYVPDELAEALIRPPAMAESDAALLAAHDDLVRAERARTAARVAATGDRVLRLPQLASGFGLDRLDVDILLLAVAPELEPRYATLVSWLQDDATQRRPTTALAADLWADPATVRVRLDADAALRSGRLLTLAEPGGAIPAPWPDRVLVPAARIVDHLLGDDRPEPALRACLSHHAGGDAPTPLARLAIVDTAAAELRRGAARLAAGGTAVVTLTGPAGSGRRTAACALAAALGRPFVVLDPSLAPADRPAPELLDSAVREARLAGATLVVLDADRLAASGADPVSLAGPIAAALARSTGAVVLTGARLWHHRLDAAAGWLDVTLAPPGFAERRALWQAMLEPATSDSAITAVAGAFRLGPGQISAAARSAARAARGGKVDHSGLSAAARAVSSHALGQLARRVTTPYTWADLVLPARTRRELEQFLAAVRHRATVQEEWGFADRQGLHVLFSGPSGTGKTMSAAIIADELGLELYAVDLAAVVSKYIGETEKNLDAIFAEGRASNAMLLFDEADALFGRRSQVKDAHDRYANLEVSYLLQRIEAYDGVTVLATNLRGNLDEAFARRLAHTIDFPPPDARLRARIWRVALPVSAPLGSDVDLEFLAQRAELTGAGIRNAAIAAAYLAAASDRPIGMGDLVQGVARELRKTGRLPSRAVFGPHYDALVGGEVADGGTGP